MKKLHRHRISAIARQIYIERHGEPICRICGKKADIHHKDENPENNRDENHDPLCRSCHTTHHNRKHPKRTASGKYIYSTYYPVKQIDMIWCVIFKGKRVYRDDRGMFFKTKKRAKEYAQSLWLESQPQIHNQFATKGGNMKTIAVVIMIVLFAVPAHAEYRFAENWTWKDTAYEAVNQSLFIVDWGQTRHMARQEWKWEGNYYSENCPFLSKRPTTSEVDTMIPIGMVAHLLISLALPPEAKVFDFKINPRRIWQVFFIGIEAAAIGNNYGTGVRIEF